MVEMYAMNACQLKPLIKDLVKDLEASTITVGMCTARNMITLEFKHNDEIRLHTGIIGDVVDYIGYDPTYLNDSDSDKFRQGLLQWVKNVKGSVYERERSLEFVNNIREELIENAFVPELP